MIQEYGHYIQAINYPTVARGEEKLRLAPTPYHTRAMMDTLVHDMKNIWQKLGMPLNGTKCSEVRHIRKHKVQPLQETNPTNSFLFCFHSQECTWCHKTILFEHYEARVRGCSSKLDCTVPNCPQMVAVAH